MSSQWVISLIVGFLGLSKATIISQKYAAKLAFDDKKSNSELLREQNAHSLTECAAMCQRECVFFGFNSQLKKCRTHKKRLTSELSDEAGWRYYSDNDCVFSAMPKDCKDLCEEGKTSTGVYDIYPYGTLITPISVYCDMTTMGGGWTVIQKRVDGSVIFDRNWAEYKNGFGSTEQNVWVGNDVIHQLTKENLSSLYVSITLQNGTTLFQMYDGFSVSNEALKYQLFLTGPATGTLGDGMLDTGYTKHDLSGMSFSTPDRDNDRSGGHCASYLDISGGWWFNNCHYGFLNGPWSPEPWGNPWYPTVRKGTSVRDTKMMIRRH
ncbi:microfibril-associated glycoprotein 4-like [Saccostrea cucullata]|uniref:microfibril-associated glycoprotein 4-like n=1 Tax=Saccostrea cuccullata TaxID=36930 RepID=UPI002ED011BB